MTRRAPLFTVVFLVAGTLACPAKQANAAFRIEQTPGQSVRLERKGEIVWQFNYAPELNKPFFDPVTVLAGPNLTCNEPADHVWHHALWFSWKNINGVNYWENDRKTGKPVGKTTWSNVVVEPKGDLSVRITMDLSYQPPEGAPVLSEKRMLKVSPPEADGTFSIDWSSTFSALAEQVVLDRTPPPGEPGGRGWGGYAGLSIRFANSMQERIPISTDGPIPFKGSTYRAKHAAIDYSGKIGDHVAGIALLNHPTNPRKPAPWYVINGKPMAYANAAFICFEPKTLKQDESLALKYRLVVHPGRWQPDQLKQAQDGFAGTGK